MNDSAMTPRRAPNEGYAEAHLWVCSGRNVGRRYRLDDGASLMGRAVDNDIVVEDERASQRHARVLVDQGRHLVEDLGSTNGTFVNNERVHRAILNDGDLIQIGQTVFEYLGQKDQRTMNSTVRGNDSDGVPDSLRAGAQQALQKYRSHEGPAAQGQSRYPAVPYNAPPPSRPPQYQAHYGGGYYEDPDYGDDSSGGNLIERLAHIKAIVSLFVPFWPLLLAFGFVGVMLGALYHKSNPPPRKASFQIILRPQGTAANVLTGGEVEGLKYFEEATQRFFGPPIVEAALTRIKGKPPTPNEVDIQIRLLKFEQMGAFQSNMYQGKVGAKTADLALKYLTTHLRVFLDREIEIGLSPVKADVKFFGQEVKKASKALERAETALAEYKTSHPEALPDQAKSNYNLLFSKKQELSRLEQQIAGLDGSLRETRRLLSVTPAIIETGQTPQNPYRVQVVKVQSRLGALRAEGKAEGHPDIMAAKAELAELEQLSNDPALNAPISQRGQNPAYVALKQRLDIDTAKVKALKEQRTEVNKSLEEQEEKIGSLPQAEAQYQTLSDAYDTARKEYTALLRKLRNEEIRLDRERARASAQYEIVVPPRVENDSGGKSRLIRVAGGGILGGLLAFMIATAWLVYSGRLTLAMLLGPNVDLSPLFGSPEEPPPVAPASNPNAVPMSAPTDHPALPASSNSNEDLPTDQEMSSPSEDATQIGNLSPEGGQTAADTEDAERAFFDDKKSS